MSGFLQDWKLNTELIQEYMWPATGDTIPFCEKAEGWFSTSRFLYKLKLIIN